MRRAQAPAASPLSTGRKAASCKALSLFMPPISFCHKRQIALHSSALYMVKHPGAKVNLMAKTFTFVSYEIR
jgi:hypothetical protein